LPSLSALKVDGITSKSSEDPFFTKDTGRNYLVSEAKVGDCEKAVFKQAWEDLEIEELAEREGRKGKIRLDTESANGKYNRSCEGDVCQW
jgi:hypothetical protein